MPNRTAADRRPLDHEQAVTVSYRAPIEQIRRLLPESREADEVSDTGFGMIAMCAYDFWVTRLGLLSVPPIRNNDMLCRVSVASRDLAIDRALFMQNTPQVWCGSELYTSNAPKLPRFVPVRRTGASPERHDRLTSTWPSAQMPK